MVDVRRKQFSLKSCGNEILFYDLADIEVVLSQLQCSILRYKNLQLFSYHIRHTLQLQGFLGCYMIRLSYCTYCCTSCHLTHIQGYIQGCRIVDIHISVRRSPEERNLHKNHTAPDHRDLIAFLKKKVNIYLVKVCMTSIKDI